MAMLAANKNNLKFDNIIKIANKIKSVEGRLEKIGKILNNSKVILDYAHTPEALELALINLKEQFPYSKISLVLDVVVIEILKKVINGRISQKYSNKIYLTDDNPRYESPAKIRADIKKGIKKFKVYEISSRKRCY